MIELVELTKYYGEAKAVGPLSLNIEAGEVVGLLGLNGAGKTTTLRMLASDLLPTCGSMKVDGVDLCNEPEKIRPMIGYLPGHMTFELGEKLKEMGMTIVNKKADDTCHIDRTLITGASPKASNKLGRLAANTLLKAVATI